jgi:hypothetical protein
MTWSQSPRSISCCSLSFQAPLSISSSSFFSFAYFRSDSRISILACSRYLAYSFRIKGGIRCASFTASSKLGKVGLGALRFLELGRPSPFGPWSSCASLLASFNALRKKPRSASGLRRPESKLVLLAICWSFFRIWETLVKT